jgi:hypothetical protein
VKIIQKLSDKPINRPFVCLLVIETSYLLYWVQNGGYVAELCPYSNLSEVGSSNELIPFAFSSHSWEYLFFKIGFYIWKIQQTVNG